MTSTLTTCVAPADSARRDGVVVVVVVVAPRRVASSLVRDPSPPKIRSLLFLAADRRSIRPPPSVRPSVRRRRVVAAPKRATSSSSSSSSSRRATVAVRASASPLKSAVASVSTASATAAIAFLASASPAMAASQTDETIAFLKAFWEFRTADPASFIAYTVLPIAVPYAVFKVLCDRKSERRRAELAAGGWDAFMLERGLPIDVLSLPQLNAFAAAAEKDLLDDEMVREFVRQKEISELWQKSTINVEDPRMENAKQRARAEKILALREEKANAGGN